MSEETGKALKEGFVKLTANIRQVGKRALNVSRKEGCIPAVLYGKDLADTVLINISKKEFANNIKDSAFNTRVKLNIEDTNKEYEVLVKSIDHGIVKGDIIHVDFINISEEVQELTCYVPLKFINEVLSPGLKRGGVLNVIHRKLYVKCNKNDMPKYLTVDLTGLEGATIITAKLINMPDTGCTLLIKNEKQAIASIIGGKATVVAQESSGTPGKKQGGKKK